MFIWLWFVFLYTLNSHFPIFQHWFGELFLICNKQIVFPQFHNSLTPILLAKNVRILHSLTRLKSVKRIPNDDHQHSFAQLFVNANLFNVVVICDKRRIFIKLMKVDKQKETTTTTAAVAAAVKKVKQNIFINLVCDETL